jgi:hypothetical protein
MLARGKYRHTHAHVRVQEKKMTSICHAQGPVPGLISNHRLLKKDGITPREGLEKGQSYRGVNKQVWTIRIRKPSSPQPGPSILAEFRMLPSTPGFVSQI